MKTYLFKKEIVIKIIISLLMYLFLLVSSHCNAQNLLQFPQSVVCDLTHNRYILSNVLATDLIAIDTAGNQSYFVMNSHINLGMVIYGNILYGLYYDDDNLRGYDLETGNLVINKSYSNMHWPYGITADTSGNLYITQNTSPGKIHKYCIGDSTFTTLINSTPSPNGICFDKKHNRLIFDTHNVTNHPIKALNLSDLSIITLTNTNFANSFCVIKDKYERYYVQDSCTNIYRFDSSFSNPPELFYHSTIYGGGMVFIDFDSVRNLIAITLSDINSWARIPVTPPVSIREVSGKIPDKFELKQNYPNPFNPSTNFRFQIPKNSFVTLKIYDILGKEIATLVNEKLNAGEYEVPFSINQVSNYNLPSGVYFYRIETENFIETKKMLLIK